MANTIWSDIQNLDVLDEDWVDRVIRINQFRAATNESLEDDGWLMILDMADELLGLPGQSQRELWSKEALKLARAEIESIYTHFQSRIGEFKNSQPVLRPIRGE